MSRERFGKPYDSNSELPEAVREALPAEAQTVYREAFNYAQTEHPDWDEGRCHQYAWGAVKKNWEQDEDGNWVKKSGGDVGERTEKAWGDLSADDIRDAIYRENRPAVAMETGGWVVELFEDYAIIEAEDGKCYRQEFSVEGDEVVLGERTEVEQEWVAKHRRVDTVEEAQEMLKHRQPLRARWEATGRLMKAHEGENGEMFLTIIASDTGPDRQGGMDPTTGKSWVAERISENFLQKMHSQAEAGSIELADGHDSGMPMGFVVGTAEVEGEGEYPQFAPVIKIEEDSATGVQLWKAAMEGRYDRGFSIGGYIDKSYVAHDADAGGMVKWLDDGELTHIATCRPDEPANPRTGMVEAMAKALRDAGDAPPVVDEEEDLPADIEPDELDKHLTADFEKNVRLAEVAMRRPQLDELFDKTEALIRESDMPAAQKREAHTAAVADYYDALSALAGPQTPTAEEAQTMSAEDIRKAVLAALEEHAEGADADDEGSEEEAGPDALALTLSELPEEQRVQVALALLDSEQFAKVFAALPGLEASSMSLVQRKLEESERLTGTLELAKSMEKMGESILKALERMEKDDAASADSDTDAEGEEDEGADDEGDGDDEDAEAAEKTIDPEALARSIAAELAKELAGEATDADEEQEGLDAEEGDDEEDADEGGDPEVTEKSNPEGLRKAIQSGKFRAADILRDRVKNIDGEGNPTD